MTTLAGLFTNPTVTLLGGFILGAIWMFCICRVRSSLKAKGLLP